MAKGKIEGSSRVQGSVGVRTVTFAVTILLVGVVLVTGNRDTIAASAAANALQPPGFSETVVFRELVQPTALRFSPDGRVFVAEKSGLIKVFGSVRDRTPTVFADLRTQVHNYWDGVCSAWRCTRNSRPSRMCTSSTPTMRRLGRRRLNGAVPASPMTLAPRQIPSPMGALPAAGSLA